LVVVVVADQAITPHRRVNQAAPVVVELVEWAEQLLLVALVLPVKDLLGLLAFMLAALISAAVVVAAQAQ